MSDAIAPPEDQVWRTSRLTQVASSLGIVGCLALAAVGILNGSRIGPIAAAYAVWLWRAGLHPRIVARANEIEVRNPFSTKLVDWDAVSACTGGWAGVRIILSNGDTVKCWAVQKMNLSKWMKRRTRADDVAEDLQRRRDATRVSVAP